MNQPKIGLFLMTSRGLAVLDSLLREHGPGAIAYLVTARDPQVQKDHHDELAATARKAGLPVFERQDIPGRLPAVAARFAAGWRWLLPEDEPGPIVVFHDSLLPRYRGFAPLVSALINAEPQLGVTALLGAKEYDRGPILGQESVPVTYPLRIAAAIEAVHPCYARLAATVYRDLRTGTWQPRAQDETRASYSLWRDEADYLINWRQDAATIRRQIDATGMPYRGAATFAEARKLRILAASELPDVRVENRTPGKIIFMEAGRPVVVCGSGLLRLEEVVEDNTGLSALPWRHFRTRFIAGPHDL